MNRTEWASFFRSTDAIRDMLLEGKLKRSDAQKVNDILKAIASGNQVAVLAEADPELPEEAKQFIAALSQISWLAGGYQLPNWPTYWIFGSRRYEVQDHARLAPLHMTWNATYSEGWANYHDCCDREPQLALTAGKIWRSVNGAVWEVLGRRPLLPEIISEAANDASLLCTLEYLASCSAILDANHLERARQRWQVWASGYGVLCDINGALCIYSSP